MTPLSTSGLVRTPTANDHILRFQHPGNTMILGQDVMRLLGLPEDDIARYGKRTKVVGLCDTGLVITHQPRAFGAGWSSPSLDTERPDQIELVIDAAIPIEVWLHLINDSYDNALQDVIQLVTKVTQG